VKQGQSQGNQFGARRSITAQIQDCQLWREIGMVDGA